MSAAQRRAFHKRMRRIDKLHRRRDHREAGLSLLGRLPLTALVVAFALGIALKSLIVANVPGGSYAQTVQSLSNGSVMEQALGWVLRPDPITSELARYVKLPS